MTPSSTTCLPSERSIPVTYTLRVTRALPSMLSRMRRTKGGTYKKAAQGGLALLTIPPAVGNAPAG